MPILQSYYFLRLKCDSEIHRDFDSYSLSAIWRQDFQAENLGRAKKKARKVGWKFKGDGRILCPDCSGKEKKKKILTIF